MTAAWTVVIWVAVIWLVTAVLLALLIGGAIRARNRQVPRDVPRRDDDRGNRP